MKIKSPFPARVTKQLGQDGVWSGYDCWIATIRGLIAFASGGLVHIDAETARKRSGRFVAHPSTADLEHLGPGNISDIAHVLRHPDTVADFKKAGLRPPKIRVLGITKDAVVIHYLKIGYQAAVAIKYGTLRELRPKSAGSLTFSDGHSVRWYGWFGVDGKPAKTAPFFSDQLDPLCDGRYAGIAEGPQRLSRRTLLAEAADLELHDGNGKVVGHVGAGRVMALVVGPARLLDSGTNQDPGPIDDCGQKVADAEAERDAALADVDRLQGQMRTIAAALIDAQAPLNVIASIAQSATGGVDS